MALDLFANFERRSNNSLFYRKSSKTLPTQTFVIKLSDLALPNEDLYSLYNVQYSINQTPFVNFLPDDNGFFQLNWTINSSVPCLCSIVVSVSTENIPLHYFDLSAKFIPDYIYIDFIAYPSLYVNLSTGQTKEVNNTNYQLSSRGIYFYGEGHTENIQLSSNKFITRNSNVIKWYVGNDIQSIITDPTQTSFWPISTTEATSNYGELSADFCLNNLPAVSAEYLNKALSNTNYLNWENEFNPDLRTVSFSADYVNQIATFQFETTANQITFGKLLTTLGPAAWDAATSDGGTSLTAVYLSRALSADVVGPTGPGVNITRKFTPNNGTPNLIDFTFWRRSPANLATLELSTVSYTWSTSANGLEFALFNDRPLARKLTTSPYLHDRYNDGILLNNVNGVLLSANTITRRIQFQFQCIGPTQSSYELISASTYSFQTSAIGALEALRAQQNFYKRPDYRNTLDLKLTTFPEYTAIRINEVVLSDLEPGENLTFYYPVTGTQTIDFATTVSISSIVYEKNTYPISIWYTNSDITTAGPIYYYDDRTGVRRYYPFFASSIRADGREEGLSDQGLLVVDNPLFINNFGYGNRLKGSIQVLEYPKAIEAILENPFPSSKFLLPVDYTPQPFWSFSSSKDVYGDAFKEQFRGTKWELQASSDIGEWSIETRFLSAIPVYQFKLCYDEDTGNNILPTFKTSAETPTTVTLTVTSYKDVYIDRPPYDWKKRITSTSVSVTATIDPIPINKIYTPSYYYVRGQDVPFSIVSYPDYPYEINELVLSSPNSTETLTLNKAAPKGTIKFNVIGIADIKITADMRNLLTGTTQKISFIYQDMIEILKNLDDPVEEESFHTSDTPLKLSYPKPQITPNEWIVVDVINSVVEKFHTNIKELISYSKLYYPKIKFYSYLAPAQKETAMFVSQKVKQDNPPIVWEDLDCSINNITDEFATWEKFTDAGLTSTWQYQNCGRRQKIDPSALEKYCIQWTWRWRKRGATDVNVKWSETKCGDTYAKKWRFEPCVIAPIALNCNRTRWNVSTIDFDQFPIPSSVPINRCWIVDAEVSKQTNQLVLAHKTEIQLVDRDKDSTHVATNKMADQLVGFQNIIGLATNNQGKVVVLDSSLPRVSIYQIDKNDFVRVDSWAKYGTAESSDGLYNPKDVYVDYENCIWIADYGNECVKKFNFIGKKLQTIFHSEFAENGPLSICMDSSNNIHCLTSKNVIVFNKAGEFLFKYEFHKSMTDVSKINVSANKHMIYISYKHGVAKFFKDGEFAFFVVKDLVCGDGYVLENFNSISQDDYRNLYVTAADKILQFADIQRITEIKAPINSNLLWKLEDLLIHKEEYVQPWVYLKAFHRLWDNIELLRTSLFYTDDNDCKKYNPPTYAKTDLIIGQNEIVSNAVINRVVDQLWTNFESLIKYFDPSCKN